MTVPQNLLFLFSMQISRVAIDYVIKMAYTKWTPRFCKKNIDIRIFLPVFKRFELVIIIELWMFTILLKLFW